MHSSGLSRKRNSSNSLIKSKSKTNPNSTTIGLHSGSSNSSNDIIHAQKEDGEETESIGRLLADDEEELARGGADTMHDTQSQSNVRGNGTGRLEGLINYQTYLLLFTILPEAIVETMLSPLIPYIVKYMLTIEITTISTAPISSVLQQGHDTIKNTSTTASIPLPYSPSSSWGSWSFTYTQLQHASIQERIDNLRDIDQLVGASSGFLTSAFYFPLLIMNIAWGVLSDVKHTSNAIFYNFNVHT
jgi:hypothetical protein